MNVLVVTGSPREGGNSDILADAFSEGVTEVGGEVRRIDAGRANIAPCDACEFCLKNEGECRIDDDMQKFYEDLHWADAVVYAFPLYYYTYTAQIKAFMDRQFCQIGGNPFGTKKAALLVPFEDKDITMCDALINSFDVAMGYCGIEVVGHVVQNACWEKGSVNNTDAPARARELGRKFA